MSGPGNVPGRHRNAANRGQTVGRVDVSEPASISSGIADRYASAVFEIANENGTIAELETSLDDLAAALDSSEELRDLIGNPLYSRDDQQNAIIAIGQKMKLLPVLVNTMGLMAAKRRLFVLPHLVARLRAKIAAHKGEVTADVTSATALSPAQADALAASLKKSVGKDVKVNATVDESLIGGLVVKVGSKMIDTSIRSKLNSLQNAMKEVG